MPVSALDLFAAPKHVTCETACREEFAAIVDEILKASFKAGERPLIVNTAYERFRFSEFSCLCASDIEYIIRQVYEPLQWRIDVDKFDNGFETQQLFLFTPIIEDKVASELQTL